MIAKYLIPVSLLAFACGRSPLNDFKRLEGTWISNDPSGQFIEQWETSSDSLMTGTSYLIVRGDTVFSENLQLVHRKGSIHYIPTVPGENEGKPVSFTLRSKKENEWLFENKQHDFPQQIIYLFKGNDSIIASVQGKENGQFRKLEFRMKRSN